MSQKKTKTLSNVHADKRKKIVKKTIKRKSTKYTIDGNGYKAYKHDAERKILATDQTGKNMANNQKRPRSYRPKLHSDREIALSWKRSDGIETQEITSTPLFIHEKIDPAAFLASLKGNIPTQSKIFENYDGVENSTKYKFYDHGANWQNRIIRGESINVMASLKDRENISNVQMIYFDPPYGMDYSAIIQSNAKKPSANENIAADVTAMKAFRDSYKDGVHSYFDNIYKTLRMARDILDETGSLFLQIGSDNVNRVGVILDEIFGSENRVQMITFVKTGGGSSDTLPGAADYILWYAKDITKLKYRQLYAEFKTDKEWFNTNKGFIMLEEDDGTSRRLTKDENADPTKIPKNSRLFVHKSLTSQNLSKDRSDPYRVKSMEKTFPCEKNAQWRVSYDGLDNLDKKNRLVQVGNVMLNWKWYKDETTGRRINNVWAEQSRPADKHYIVETSESVIERCILMSTDPGDLVYDPTCGSGTTAYVAEKWGRRWITSDAGAVAITFARQRLATAVFKYYHLIDTEAGLLIENKIRDSMQQKRLRRVAEYSENPSDGFVLERTPKLTAATLAYDSEPEIIYHPNRPKIDNSLNRISSPFTIETLSPYRYENPESLLNRASGDKIYSHVQKTVIEALENSGINMNGTYTKVTNIKPVKNGRCITHQGVINNEKAAILIAPPDCTIPYDMVNRAEEQASRIPDVDIVIIIGFSWEGSAYTKAEEMRGVTKIFRVQASMDLQVENLKSGKNDNTLVMIGEPRISITKNKELDKISISIDGYDTYDPGTGNLREGKPDEIICWMLDSDFDGSSFFARWIHFPSGINDKQIKKFYKQLEDHIDPKLWDSILSTKSVMFDKPKSNRIAIRIITETHMEMTEVIELDDKKIIWKE